MEENVINFNFQKKYRFETSEIPPGIFEKGDNEKTVDNLVKSIVSISFITIELDLKTIMFYSLRKKPFLLQYLDLAQIGITTQNLIKLVQIKWIILRWIEFQ